MVEFNEQKFKQIKDPIVRALGSGLLSMAHNIGKTVFSHTIITREIVKSLSDIFNELGATIDSVKYSRYGEKTKKSIVKLRREFMHLKEKIDGGIEFAEADASELVRALNEFILFRLEIGLLECESHLTGENRIIEIMMGRSGSRGKLLLQRRVETMEEDLIPGLKYIVGHDYDINHNYNLDFDGRVLYADSSRSHGYNHNYSYVNFSLVSNKYLKNSSRLELPSRTGEHNTGKDPEMACFYRAITPDNLEERAMTNFKKIEKHLLSLLC
jgi:hypothetical protein